MSILFLILNCFSLALNVFSKSFLIVLGNLIGDFWFYIARFRRRVVLENLKKAFKNEKPEKELLEITRANFRHYCLTLLEILQAVSWTPDQYRKNMRLEGEEFIRKLLREGKGGYLLTGHFGNWEIAIGAIAAHGIPLDIVAKRAASPFFQKLLQWYREKLGVGILFESGSALRILRSVNEGRFIGFILDQFMGPPIGLPVTFFGEKAGTMVALALLTDKKPIPILPSYSRRDAQGKLAFVFEEPISFSALSEDKNERLYQKTQMFNETLEKIVRKHPEQWLWLHRRFKEYKGEPNWKRKVTVFSVQLIALGLLSCSSLWATEPTGIQIPKPPEVTIPRMAKVIPPKTIEKNTSKKPASVPQEGLKLSQFSYDSLPFEFGEKLEIELGWSGLSWIGFKAGTTTLEVRKTEDYKDRKLMQFFGTILSSRLVDAVYHIDNAIESLVDAEYLIPYRFLLHMFETDQKKEVQVSFDHSKKNALFWTKRLSQKWGDENIDRVDPLVPQARDMFSAIYYARTLNFKLNQKQSFVVYENGKNWDVELNPVAHEIVKVPAGVFQCFKILVTVKFENYLRPTGDVYIWLSDDDKKFIVKFDARVKIGSIFGNLVNIRERL